MEVILSALVKSVNVLSQRVETLEGRCTMYERVFKEQADALEALYDYVKYLQEERNGK